MAVRPRGVGDGAEAAALPRTRRRLRATAARAGAAIALAVTAAGCAPTVPLAQHQALETRFGELEARVDKISAENERLKMMVATQRQIIRDLRCLKEVDIQPAPEPSAP